jgi:signal transduction histidine kinase
MGLAVCRWILDEMGGGIRLVPTARGACFELELPTTSPERPAAPG